MLIHNCSNKYIKLSVYSNNLCSFQISGLKTYMSVDGNLRHFQCCHPNWPKPKFGRCAYARVLCRKGLFTFIYRMVLGGWVRSEWLPAKTILLKCKPLKCRLVRCWNVNCTNVRLQRCTREIPTRFFTLYNCDCGKVANGDMLKCKLCESYTCKRCTL